MRRLLATHLRIGLSICIAALAMAAPAVLLGAETSAPGGSVGLACPALDGLTLDKTWGFDPVGEEYVKEQSRSAGWTIWQFDCYYRPSSGGRGLYSIQLVWRSSTGLRCRSEDTERVFDNESGNVSIEIISGSMNAELDAKVRSSDQGAVGPLAERWFAQVRGAAGACAGDPPEASTPDAPSTASACTELSGRITARGDAARDNGDIALPRTRLTLAIDGDEQRTATDMNGRYRFAIDDANDPRPGTTAALRIDLIEARESTPAWEVFWNDQLATVTTAPIKLTDAASCTRDIDTDRLANDVTGLTDDAQAFADAASQFARTAAAWTYIERLQIDDLFRSPPLRIYARCSVANPPPQRSCGPSNSAGYRGSHSDPRAQLIADPSIAFGIAEPGHDWGDVAYHELGHAALDAVLGTVPTSAATSQNHGGYWINPDTTDSLAEGFAQFFALQVRAATERTQQPEVSSWWHYRFADSGISRSYESDRLAWNGTGEDDAVTGVLVDLFDGEADHAKRAETALEVSEPVLDGRTATVNVTNPHERAIAQPLIVMAWLDAEGDPIAATLPFIGPSIEAGETIEVDDELPESAEAAASVRAIGDLSQLGDDDPVDAAWTMQDLFTVWTASSTRTPELSRDGTAVTMLDLHDALRADGRTTREDLDAVFVAHGFHDDLTDGTSNQSFDDGREQPGFTDHAASAEGPEAATRHARTLDPALLVPITFADGVDADDVMVRVWHGRTNVKDPLDAARAGGAYETKVRDGAVFVDVQQDIAEGAFTNVAVRSSSDDGALTFVQSIDAGQFWADVRDHPQTPPISFTDVALDEAVSTEDLAPAGIVEDGGGDDDDPRTPAVLWIGGAAVLGAGVLAAAWWMTRRRRGRRGRRAAAEIPPDHQA